MKKSSIKLGRWLLSGIVILFLFSIIAGKSGLLSLLKIDNESTSLSKSIELEKSKIDSLTLVEERLRVDKSYIKRVVKEELGYIENGETVIRFEDRK